MTMKKTSKLVAGCVSLLLAVSVPINHASAATGYATQNGNTTGGEGGDTVRVSTGSQLHKAICDRANDDTPLIIEVDGTITLGNTEKHSGSCNTTDDKIELKEISNISIIGIGSNAVFDKIGIHIRESSNIILRNLHVRDVTSSNGGDAIGMESNVSNVWVDHCTLEAFGGENEGYDSLFDMKNNTKYITLSYSVLKNSGRGGLVGSADGDDQNNYITYHHNHFQNIDSRAPLLRHATAHIYNNFYDGINKSGINPRIGGRAKVQNNVFENAKDPLGTFYTSDLGTWEVSGNIWGPGVTWTSEGEDNYPAGPSPSSTTFFSVPYSYAMDNADCIKSIVLNSAGHGTGLAVSNGGCDGSTSSSTSNSSSNNSSSSSSSSSSSNSSSSNSSSGGTINCAGVNEYPNWTSRNWDGGEYDHAAAGDQMTYQNMLYQANWYTNTQPGSGNAWTLLGACGSSSSSTSSSSSSSSTSSNSTSSSSSSSSSGGPGTTELTIEEGERGFCGVDGDIESEYSGFSGSGYANTDNEDGNGVRWRVSVAESENYLLEFTYANQSEGRSAAVEINGQNRANLTLSTTGAWNAWTMQAINVPLVAGVNDIALLATNPQGLANIDDIKLVGNSVQAADCGGSSSSSSSSTSSTSTSSSSNSSSSSSSGGNPGNLADGFASISGDGRSGTNGGEGGETVTVSNFNDLVAQVADNNARIVRVSGTINGSGMVNVGSNKTIIGIGSGASLSGFGLNVNTWGQPGASGLGDACDADEVGLVAPVENVIIANLNFRDADDDSINVQCWAHHVWIHHNTFYPANDGSVDIKRGSDMVTVSYNRFVGTEKSMLLGHSNKPEIAAMDRGNLRVTYHHNWFDGSRTRHPRVRFGYAHLYNNYWQIDDYAIGLGIEANVYAEANFVHSGKTITSIFSESTGYRLTWTGSNVYDTATITRANDSGKTQKDWLDADGSVPRPTAYSYNPGPAPSSPPNAGAGTL